MDAVTVLSGRRAGAGHLLALLRNIESVAPCDTAPVGTDDVAAVLDQAESEARGAGRSLLVVAATPDMPIETIERAMLSRPGMRAVFVMRRQIDAYVSLAKAKAMNAWRDTDLTPVKVKLDAARFADWLDAQQAWYAHWADWLERRALPRPILRYESHLTLPPETVLRRFASTVGQVGLTLKVPAALPYPGLVRQDRETVAAFRVRNWPDFSRAINEMGLERRAFGYPL